MTTRTSKPVALDRAVEIGDVVRGLRKYGLSEGDIGKASGVSERSVRYWIRTSAARRRQEEKVWALKEIVLLLRETLTPKGVGQWLRAPNRLLGGRRPIDLLAEGKMDAVRNAAASYAEGTYV